MTREQAIEVLGMVEAHGGIVIEAKSMAIEALKFQSKAEVVISQLREDRDRLLTLVDAKRCEDAISRQAAIDAILTKYTEYERLKMLHFTPNIIKQECADLLTDLPSVTPKQRTGRWEWTDGDERIMKASFYTKWTCTSCGCKRPEKTKYCPNCGAKMEEQG